MFSSYKSRVDLHQGAAASVRRRRQPGPGAPLPPPGHRPPATPHQAESAIILRTTLILAEIHFIIVQFRSRVVQELCVYNRVQLYIHTVKRGE